MIWAGIIGNHIIRPFTFEATVSGASYLHILQQNVVPALIQFGIVPAQVIFQHDGAPPHYSTNVRTYLTHTFERWIGRGSDTLWPPRSPDFNPLDYFLWGHIKHQVYLTPPEDMDDLMEKIIEACQAITPIMLLHVRNNFIRRMELSIVEAGGHVEHLL